MDVDALLNEVMANGSFEEESGWFQLVAREKNPRLTAERLQASISEELNRTDEKMQSINVMFKQLQEFLEEQFKSSSTMQDEAMKQKEILGSEVASLTRDLQQVRDDRDSLSLQVLDLSAKVEIYEECIGRTMPKLERLVTTSTELEVRCFSRSKKIRLLEEQLALVQKKSQLPDKSAMEIISEFEKQKTFNLKLQKRLTDADKLRKKMHNTIMELKGNIRVFCRVRPLLSDDEAGAVTKILIPYGNTGSRHPFDPKWCLCLMPHKKMFLWRYHSLFKVLLMVTR